MDPEELDKKFTELADNFQKRFDDLNKKVEERLSRLEQKPAPSSTPPPRLKKHHDSVFWGLVLLIIGIILLGNDFRWFYLDIPVLPTALIILGGYLVIENRQR